MEVNEMKELIKILNQTDFNYVEIKHEGSTILLSKDVISEKTTQKVLNSKTSNEEIQENKIETINENENISIIKSPIVGTFYRAPSPDADPYVKKGDMIKKGDIVCIIEAMKLMNEIEAEVDGEIVEVCVNNEDMVEYGQPLFKVKTK